MRALFLACTLCAGLPAQTAWAQVRLPALGEAAGEEFSLGTERNLGEQIMREIRRDPDYLDDPPLLEYLQGVWKPLVEAARQRGEITAETAQLLAWEVFLVRDRSVNAFALPGGYVGVHLGLIAVTASSDELAAVLAHELSHVTQRHIARSIVNTQRTTLLSLAGLILGVLAASRAGSSDATQAAVVGAQAAAAQSQLNYSRDMEREADRVGFGVLTDAGYAPQGMAGMFEKMENANRMNDSGAFPYLRSHPLTVERISEARSRLALAAGAAPADNLQHGLMGARARVLMDTSTDGLRRQQQRLAGAVPSGMPAAAALNEQLAALYGGALAAALLRDQANAEAAVAKALELLGGRAKPAPAAERDFKLLQAQLWLQGRRRRPRDSAARCTGACSHPRGRPCCCARRRRWCCGRAWWPPPTRSAPARQAPRRRRRWWFAAHATRPSSCCGKAPRRCRAGCRSIRSDPLAWGTAGAGGRGARPAAACHARTGRGARRAGRHQRRRRSAACRAGAGAQRCRQRLHRSLGDRRAAAPARRHAPAARGRHARQAGACKGPDPARGGAARQAEWRPVPRKPERHARSSRGPRRAV